MFTTLNISSSGIRLVSFNRRQVLKWGSAPLSPGLVKDGVILKPNVVGAVIDALFSSTGASRDQVIASLTGLSFVYRILELPHLDAGSEGEAIRRAARQEMPLPLDELYLSWQALDGGKTEQDFFVLGVPRRPVDALARTLDEAGVKLSDIEMNPLALARTANRENAIVVSLEPDCFDIVVIAGGMPAIMHTITPAGERAGLEDNIKRLLDELVKTVEFHNGSHPGERLGPDTPLLLTGELAGDAAASGMIQAEMPYPVSLLVPPLKLPSDMPASSFTTSIGLALKRMGRGRSSYRDINLDILTGEKKALARQFRLSYLLLSLAIVVILGLLFPVNYLKGQVQSDAGRLQAELTAVRHHVQEATLAAEEDTRIRAEIEEVLAAAAELKSEHSLILNRGGGFTSSLKMVTDALPPAAYFTSIGYSGGGILLSGQAADPFTVVDYVTALEALGEYAEVRIIRISDSDILWVDGAGGENTGVTFNIEITASA